VTTPPLVSVAELATSSHPRVFDTRWYLADHDRGRAEYARGHIPGAVFVDLETQLSARRGPGRHPLPSPVRFAATLGRLGVTPESSVVVYDDAGGAIAARMWWMMRALGHMDVRVLDGGYQAWTAAGHAVSTDSPTVEPVPYPVLMSDWPLTVTADEVAAGGRVTLVDARAPERYRGDTEPVDARAGHIPGAVNVPHAANLDPNGLHLPRDVLADRYAGIGPDPIVYCGSGVTACADILAMETVGITGVRLYPGSWSDWSSDPERPVATGDLPG